MNDHLMPAANMMPPYSAQGPAFSGGATMPGRPHNQALNDYFNSSTVAASGHRASMPTRKRSTPFEEDDDSDYEIIEPVDEESETENDEPEPARPEPRSKSKAPVVPKKAARTSKNASPHLSNSKSPRSSTTPKDIIGAFSSNDKKAKSAKNQPLSKIDILSGPPKHMSRRKVENDPENRMIKKFREQGYHWGVIAQLLDQERINTGGNPGWTAAAVYSRFVRNAPKIAEADGQQHFDVRDFMHLKNEKKTPPVPIPGPTPRFSENAQDLLVEVCRQTKENYWQEVADRMSMRMGRPYTAEQCAREYNRLL